MTKFLRAVHHVGCRSLSSYRYFPVNGAEGRMKAIGELKKRVDNERDCWGYMVESLITTISLEERASEKDVQYLMKVCKRDIVDFFPREQKRITQNAWSTIKKIELYEARDPLIYNLALEAFLFQDVDIDEDEFISDMNLHKTGPNSRTYENFLHYHCKRKDIEKALKLLEARSEAGVPLNEIIASRLVYCHASRGEFSEAEEIVSMLDKRNIFYGKSIPHAFVLGAAKKGDIEKLAEFIELYSPGDQVMLQALVELCRVSPSDYRVVMNGLPVHKEFMSRVCRRTVKELVELDKVDIARELVLKSESVPENSTNKEMVISVSPSVIVLSELLKSESNPLSAISLVYDFLPVDSKVTERAIVILFDLAFEEPKKKSFCAETIKGLLRENFKALKGSEGLISQNITRKIKECKTDNEVLYILKTSSDLGIKLTHLKEWNAALFRLIPIDEEYTVKSLIQRVREIRDCLDCMTLQEGGMYSNSVLWSQIIKYLLTIKSDLFMKATAQLIRNLGVPYGPKRWYDSLGYNLVHTGDVDSFADILEAAYENSSKRMDGEDYRQLTISILVAINVANRHNENISRLLLDLFDKIWERNLLLPQEVRDKMVVSIPNDEIAQMARNLPVLGTENFRSVRPMGLSKSRQRKKKRQVNEADNFI